MNPDLNTESVKRLLARSAGQTGPTVQAKLREAREQALLRYDARRNTAPAYAWAGLPAGAGARRSPLYWACAALLVAGLLSTATWWQHKKEHEDTDVDIAILTDDMPLHVYAD